MSRLDAAEPLLSPAFLERLRTLRVALLRRRRRRGELQGLGFGQMPELEANRPYEPGDDLRYLDWKLYARLERLWVRLYVLDDSSHASILVDTSRSMGAPPEKLRMAAQFAAAFAYLVLASGRALRVGVYADGLLAARGPVRSLHHFPAVHALLGALPRGRGTSLARGSEAFFARVRGQGPLFVISDFLQEEDVLAQLERLHARGADLHLVQVIDPGELEPRLHGTWRVSDLEGDGTLDLAVGADLLEDLRRAVGGYVGGIERASRERSVPYLLARVGEPFEEIFFRHLSAEYQPHRERART